ncbi:MAG: hypothetical protein E4H26_02895 [Flavobacteriales bacterium]|nr:MAG: hypothetical protein E4H26_02895 [Flavobacteriales bacterium]
MEKDKEKNMEVLLKNTIQEIGLETPSIKFTEQLLSRIQLAGQKRCIPEKPLISKRTWGLLLFVVMGISAYLILGNGKMETTWGPSYAQNVDRLAIYLDFASSVHLSNTVTYGLVGLTLFVCIQVFVLKHHFNKRYSF